MTSLRQSLASAWTAWVTAETAWKMTRQTSDGDLADLAHVRMVEAAREINPKVDASNATAWVEGFLSTPEIERKSA